MMTPNLAKSLLISICATAFLSACDPGGSENSGAAGVEQTQVVVPDAAHADIDFPISCSETTQRRFTHGIYLLHNMMYVQARAEFKEAAAEDDQCAMLHWGIAMTMFQPRWPGTPTDDAMQAGADALAQARILGVNASERERDYIEAVGTYYADWQDRDRGERKATWRVAHEALAIKYPDDSEAQIFFGLARLTTVDPYDRSHAEDFEVAGVLEEILLRRPNHPGVLHYLVHAYDNSVHAEKGLPAADKYDKIAPDAPHALHMPTHIYVRIGDWQRVIDGNIRSADVAMAQPVAGGKVSKHYLHALDYMVYGYLQIGNDALAAEAAANIRPDTPWEPNSGAAGYAFTAIPARLTLDQHDWQGAMALEARAIPFNWDNYPWADAITHAARGLGAARAGEVDMAKAELAELERLSSATKSAWWQQRIAIQNDVIAGWVAVQENRLAEGEALLRSAAEAEVALGKQPVEPAHVIHGPEQLGEFLAMQGRHEEALKAYRMSLADSPKRYWSLLGAAQALQDLGMADEAVHYYGALIDMADESSDRAGLKHAQAFLGERGSDD